MFTCFLFVCLQQYFQKLSEIIAQHKYYLWYFNSNYCSKFTLSSVHCHSHYSWKLPGKKLAIHSKHFWATIHLIDHHIFEYKKFASICFPNGVTKMSNWYATRLLSWNAVAIGYRTVIYCILWTSRDWFQISSKTFFVDYSRKLKVIGRLIWLKK